MRKEIGQPVSCHHTQETTRPACSRQVELLPYPLLSVQVDGGSEFMAEFEQTCKDLTLPLYACLQQAGGTRRYEFYSFYEGPLTLAAINRKLAQYPHCYNHYPPMMALDCRPLPAAGRPMAYYRKLKQAA